MSGIALVLAFCCIALGKWVSHDVVRGARDPKTATLLSHVGEICSATGSIGCLVIGFGAMFHMMRVLA